MAEFLHQIVKKREREQEMHTLQDSIFRYSSQDVFRPPLGRGFVVPSRPIPPANEIAYRFHTMNGITEHSVIFPNVAGWIQSVVIISTPATTILRSPQRLTLNAWELIAGHACRPNYRWEDNHYVCSSCAGSYATDGSEWQNG